LRQSFAGPALARLLLRPNDVVKEGIPMSTESAAHILIVDDDTSFATAVAEIATLQGLHADTAATLNEARSKLREQSFDLVLLDLDLPDGNGLTLFNELDPDDCVPVAIVTGNPSVESAARSVRLPVVDYLVKPLAHDALSALFGSAAVQQHPVNVNFRVGMTLEEVERQMLFKTLAHFHNHKPKTAQVLGVSLKTIYNRLARFGRADPAAESVVLQG
jgi:DNA-binding NtrC family response regulator